MIADLKPYPEYKESGLPWVGAIPSHWAIRPAFGVFSPNNESNRGMKECRVLSLSYGRIIVKPAEKLHGLVPESFETYQVVNPGDIILRTVDLQNDHTSLRVGLVRDRGIITSAYLALRVAKDVSAEFGFQFLNAWDTSKAIYGYGSGLRQNLDFQHFKRMPIPLPPPSEQAAIVRFLDWANGRLERAIRAKRKVIALLHEQKQAIIHKAVTQGLDPNVPKRDSGIPWLGEIPAHWEVRKLKSEVLFRGGGTPEKANPAYWNGTIPWVSPKDMKFDLISDAADHITARAVAESSTNIVPAGSLLMVVRSGILQRTIPVARCSRDVALNQDMKAIISKGRLDLDWFVLLIRGSETRLIREWTKQGATVESVEHQYLANTNIPIPPLCEQVKIVNELAFQTDPLVTAIDRYEREITLLREYRTRLVADVVTGKLDVREAAQAIPEEDVVLASDGVEDEAAEPEMEDVED
jgi:type I restriction enzyme S subunit